MIDPDAFLMTLDEARQVRWLKSDPRPLGELFDEGYLDQARLEWAVAKAYNPRLRRAAMVLLREAKEGEISRPGLGEAAGGPAVAGGMNLEEAEATPWPFLPCRGQPMGSLVETRQLSLKDLGYAIENAYDLQVRRAAETLLNVRLGQEMKTPAPSAGFVKWTSGSSSFSHRREMQIDLLQGILLGVVAGAALTAFLIFLFRLPASFYAHLSLAELIRTPSAIVGTALLIVLVGVIILGVLLLNRLIHRMEWEIESYRQGQEGEQRTAEVILQTLDGNWTLFRNLRLPGRNKADLDLVLVGPPGVWVLEVKNLSGLYRNNGETWEFRQKNRWLRYRASPSRQAKESAARLGAFLKTDGVKQWVEPAIVWADPECQPAVENPSVSVWPLERLPDELGNLWQEEKIPLDVRTRIVDKLIQECEKSR